MPTLDVKLLINSLFRENEHTVSKSVSVKNKQIMIIVVTFEICVFFGPSSYTDQA